MSDSEMQEDTTCSRFCNTFLKQRHQTHITLCSGRLVPLSVELGAMYRGSSERSTVGGGFRACPYGSSVLPGGRFHPGRAQIQPSLRGRAQHSTTGDKVITSTLQASRACSQGQLEVGISALTLWGSNPAHPGHSCFQEPGQGHRAPGLLPKHKPLVLYTRHWTNSSTNKIKSLLHATP